MTMEELQGENALLREALRRTEMLLREAVAALERHERAAGQGVIDLTECGIDD